MALELTVTAKGQVTLRRAVLEHLGVLPGVKVSVSLLENGRIELVSVKTSNDIRGLRGALRRSRQAAAGEGSLSIRTSLFAI